MKKIVMILSFLMPMLPGCYAMQQGLEAQKMARLTKANHYHQTPIKPQTIAHLAESMPDDLNEVVTNWSKENQDLLHTIIHTSDSVPVTTAERLNAYQLGIAAFRSKNINIETKFVDVNGQQREVPGLTYMFALPTVNNKTYLFQASGPALKRYNLEAYNGKGWEDGFDPAADTKHPTFQTVSRVVGYLKCKQAIEEKNTACFYAPKTYLAQIPGRSDNKEYACDGNSFVVQETYDKDNWLNAHGNLAVFNQVNPNNMQDLYYIIKNAILWDINGNLMVNKQTGQLGQSDLEQGGDQNPEMFAFALPTSMHRKLPTSVFEHVYHKLSHDQKRGISEFGDLLKEAHESGVDVAALAREYKKAILTDAEIALFPGQLQKEAKQCMNWIE